jgi:hypothetical protein
LASLLLKKMSSRRQLSNIPSQPQQQTIGIPYAIIYLRKLSTTRSHSTNQCTTSIETGRSMHPENSRGRP